MPRYNYVALDARGEESTGLLEASSTNEAIGQLRQAGYFPTSVYEEARSSPDGKAGKEARQRRGENGSSDAAARENQHCSFPAQKN